jgi:hypothetical protein
VLCGTGGVLIGYYVAGGAGWRATKGVDWLRWIISIIVAVILVVTARRSPNGNQPAGLIPGFDGRVVGIR